MIIKNRHKKDLICDSLVYNEVMYLQRKIKRQDKLIAKLYSQVGKLTNWGVSTLTPRHAWAAMRLSQHSWIEILPTEPKPFEREEAVIPVTILRGHR